MEVGLVLARRIVRAVERKHPRAGSRVRSLAERTKLRMLVRQWQIRMVSRRLREWIFLREEDKYQRRTRNSTTYYLHLPRPSLVLLGEDLIASKIHQGRAGLKPEIRLRVHMRESAISWFSFVPLGSALLVLLGLLPFGTETEGAFAPVTLSASAIISYVFFSYDKPALRRALAPRLLAALALWYLVLSGVRVDLPI